MINSVDETGDKMESARIVEEFEATWAYTRKMTTEFIKCVPDEKWHFSHHRKFGPLCKQFRHMVCVYGCYVEAFRTRKMDLSKKKSYYSGDLQRENILASLKLLDQQLKEVLSTLKSADLNSFQVDFFGLSMGFTEYCDVLIQHESSHFGIWSNYAAFGEFETPKLWQDDWKL